MRFLYTGAQIALQPQPNPYLSLGGLMSSTIVPNGRINSLFDDASYSSVKNGAVMTRALILQNETNVDALNVTLGYRYSLNPDFSIMIAIVTLTGGNLMEQIGNSGDTPYYATFSQANIDPNASPPINNSLQLGTIPSNSALGVWIQRTQNIQTLIPVDFSLPQSPLIDAINFIVDWNTV